MSRPYEIDYAKSATDDIRDLRPFDRKLILEGIERHLTHEPKRVSRSRIIIMMQPFWSRFRLRLDDFRVYYIVEADSRRVEVLRVLEKTTELTPEVSP